MSSSLSFTPTKFLNFSSKIKNNKWLKTKQKIFRIYESAKVN